MNTVIETRQLSRQFGAFVAVDKLDLSVNQGEIFGLLGPNAAGKSTTIRMLAGILQPSSGSANLLNLDLGSQTEAIKQHIGYVAQHFSLYPDLTVSENLRFYAGLYGVNDTQRLREQLHRYDLDGFADRHAGLLSGGYQRRLAIACATTHEPDIVFLDEPTAGIDPVTRKELWDLFYTLAAGGKTLFVTTHYMEEAERCNRLAFLSHGRLAASGTPTDIRSTLGNRHIYSIELPYHPELSRQLATTPGVLLVNQFGNELRIVTESPVDEHSLNRLIADYFPGHQGVSISTPDIEDAFMILTMQDDAT